MNREGEGLGVLCGGRNVGKGKGRLKGKKRKARNIKNGRESTWSGVIGIKRKEELLTSWGLRERERELLRGW